MLARLIPKRSALQESSLDDMNKGVREWKDLFND